jgi:hypothetical protein
MKFSIKVYLTFFVFFEFALYIVFKIIHTLIPSTLIFDQIFLISFLNTSLFLIFLRKKVKIDFDKVVAIVALGLFLMFLNQTFILNIDRSRSTYVLSWVDQGLVSKSESGSFITSGILSKENSNELGTIQRLRENVDRGLISVKGEKVQLTLAGSLLLQICEGTANLFDLQGWKTNSK